MLSFNRNCGKPLVNRDDQKHGECLNKKMYYSERHTAINLPQNIKNTPFLYKRSYSIILGNVSLTIIRIYLKQI